MAGNGLSSPVRLPDRRHDATLRRRRGAKRSQPGIRLARVNPYSGNGSVATVAITRRRPPTNFVGWVSRLLAGRIVYIRPSGEWRLSG
jgi:hypothetical protein